MSIEFSPEILDRLNKAYYLWFTTVRDDGTPQPTPVWFIYENDTFLIYTMNSAQKLRNLADNPRVALSYTDSHDAETFLVIMGDAAVDRGVPPASKHPAYYAKYATGIPEIGMTPEQFDANFPVTIRVTPKRVRTES